jgi:hypothetical protein
MNPDPLNGGRDENPAGRDPEWEAWLAYLERCEDDEPLEFDDDEAEYEDPEALAEIIAEAGQAAADQAAAEARRKDV